MQGARAIEPYWTNPWQSPTGIALLDKPVHGLLGRVIVPVQNSSNTHPSLKQGARAIELGTQVEQLQLQGGTAATGVPRS
jgi:hypothetical protein